MDKYLKETKMLDYSDEQIQRLIFERKWRDAEQFERLKSIYNFVRDEILFGYNADDSIPASKVLSDGYGQCNTKGRCSWRCSGAAASPAGFMALPLIRSCKKGP